MREHLVTAGWIAVLAAVVGGMLVPESRAVFEEATRAHPYLMGFCKIGLLGTMGELLSGKIVQGRWRFRGIRLWQRVLVWGVLGMIFAVVFPVFSFGVDGVLGAGLLPGAGVAVITAFWKSFFMNVLFGFPMMVSHRVTDGLIDRGRLFSLWPLTEVYTAIDWRTMFRVVGAACFWFWTPAHTITFLLPPEYRVLSAALLAIVLGFILGMAKRRATVAAPSAGRLELVH